MRHRNVLMLLLLVLASFQKQIAAELVAYGRGKVSWYVYSAVQLATDPSVAPAVICFDLSTASQHSTTAASRLNCRLVQW
jgi:hypothetical protein